MIRLLYLMFVLSGAAGLMYESIWTRYLGLFVGHDAYAQIVVLTIFLGGMSAGALIVSRFSARISQPLYGYAIIELLVGGMGLVFHDGFQAVTAWAYASLYSGLPSSWMISLAKWSIASGLILPQSILLGATFPLMSAGALRLNAARPGRTVSALYFANSLGAAAGVLVAGFYLLGAVGLPGTLTVAAVLNIAVAAGTAAVGFIAPRSTAFDAIVSEGAGHTEPNAPSTPAAAPISATEPDADILRRLLLITAFGTAVASFIYEIAWLRMLALVLGSATHSFELMLSAFILGLALGALWVRSRADRFQNSLVALGTVQWIMGALALATIVLYTASFGWLGALLKTFAETDAGYAGFTIAKYGLCLAIMLPATFCAGMTLPLITRTLMVSGLGERAIGAVYGWNTLGSIVGVIAAGLVLLPVLGLKGMLVTGALIDMAIGALLIGHVSRLVWAAAVGTVAVVVIALAAPGLDPAVLASGIFRGRDSEPGERQIDFHADGRTSTVTGFQYAESKLRVLSTNGKPDASLSPIWFRSCDSIKRVQPMYGDGATQALLPLLSLAHAPEAKSVAMIGHGSGMSSHFLLASEHLEELVTIEIEPQMLDGSRTFYPANRRAFDDPRVTFVIDDAKSYFASAHRRFDLLISEPSNPWVSGVSSLFTDEFYRRIRQYLTDDGVFTQWLQVYELDDALVLSVLAALHRNFPAYEVYLIPEGDLLVVASNRTSVPTPDWSVAELPRLRADLCRFVPPTPETFSALHLVGRRELAPLLDHYGQPNSDFFPALDLGAERRRFRSDYARGFSALSAQWFNLLSSLTRRSETSDGEALPSFPENPRLRARAVATYLRVPSAGAADVRTVGSSAEQAAYQWQTWQMRLASAEAPTSWLQWVNQSGTIQRLRNGGAAGVTDNELYAATMRFLERHDAPAPVRDVVLFRHSIASWDFPTAAAAADRLVPLLLDDEVWIDADELRDGGVIAKLHVGDREGARRILHALTDYSDRYQDDLRTQLLDAYVEHGIGTVPEPGLVPAVDQASTEGTPRFP